MKLHVQPIKEPVNRLETAETGLSLSVASMLEAIVEKKNVETNLSLDL